MHVAFFGLGNMGAPMAANLARAGHAVHGFDPSEAAQTAARQAGVGIAHSAPAALDGADAVITMLPAGRHVLAAYRGADGLLARAQPGTLFIDCSTIDVADSREAHRLAAEAGHRPVDAPVSGGVGGATAGTLTFMCGGAAEAFEAAEPLLAVMGKKIVHCGGAGAGQAAKICNNMVLGVSMIAVGEAFVLGEKLGLAHDKLFEVMSTASAQCWSLTTYCPVPGPVPASPANRRYAPGFATALMLKDLRLADGAARDARAETALGQAATRIFEAYAAAGGAEQDFSGVIEFVRRRSGGENG